MRVATVENFLCCFKLEIAAYLMGWLGVVLTLVLFSVATVLAVKIFLDFDGMKITLTEKVREFDFYPAELLVKFILWSYLSK